MPAGGHLYCEVTARWRICGRLLNERVGLVEARQLSEVLQATQ